MILDLLDEPPFTADQIPTAVAPEHGYFADEPGASLVDVRDDLALLLDEVMLGQHTPTTRAQIMPVGAGDAWIYFVRAVGTELVKIGFTSSIDPRARISSLQTGCPHELVLEAHVAGAQDIERALHAALASRRQRGEWFVLSADEVRTVVRRAWHGAFAKPCNDCGTLGDCACVAVWEDGDGERHHLLDVVAYLESDVEVST